MEKKYVLAKYSSESRLKSLTSKNPHWTLEEINIMFKKFPDGSKPIFNNDVPAEIGMGYAAVLIDGKGIKIWSGWEGEDYYRRKRFKSATNAKRWYKNNIQIPLNKKNFRKLGIHK